MTDLRYTLLSDGSSDRALIPVLTWLLREVGMSHAIQSQWADLRRLRSPPTAMDERIRISLGLFPCDLLFVHRDSENQPRSMRLTEIKNALGRLGHALTVPAVCVIPVRMSEAWLLFNESAVRHAAGNPNGHDPLGIPPLSQIEGVPDPKAVLDAALRAASGVTRRRRRRVPVSTYVTRVAELIDDFSPLRNLSAFQALEADLRQTIALAGWAR